MNYRIEYEKWLTDELFGEEIRKELKAIEHDEKEIEDRFYKQLSFGTGGLRGVIGAGTNRMNKWTVGKATQGLANFINSSNEEKSVAIAYDSRRMSKEFALNTALVFAGNGIKAYLFESLRPTPELSFAVRHLKTTAGVVITASHNPPEYNGYKVYWSDGAQIVAPYDKLIIDEVNAVEDYASIKILSEEDAIKKGLLNYIGSEVDDEYIKQLKKNVLNPDIIKQQAKNLKIVYTPLHGTGRVPVKRILKEMGFENVWVEQSQEMPDGNFPTVDYPNPEDKKAFKLALELAKEKDADVVLATDPDADRLGIYALDYKTKEYMPFTGNMSGLLILEYILSQKKEKGLLPKNPKTGAVVTTIVSSKMAREICDYYGLTIMEVLTGFKYIGEQIKLFEDAKEKNGGEYDYLKGAYEYLFGYEESYGCLVGIHARDKDAVIAVAMLCEAAAYYKSKGISLWEQMINIYEKYGYYKESLSTKVLAGKSGMEKMQEILDSLRKTPIAKLGKDKVVAIRDYQSGKRKDLITGEISDLTLPKSNVIYYELENCGWCCVRPSGTEPKIKFYSGVKGESFKEAEEKLLLQEGDLSKLTD